MTNSDLKLKAPLYVMKAPVSVLKAPICVMKAPIYRNKASGAEMAISQEQ